MCRLLRLLFAVIVWNVMYNNKYQLLASWVNVSLYLSLACVRFASFCAWIRTYELSLSPIATVQNISKRSVCVCFLVDDVERRARIAQSTLRKDSSCRQRQRTERVQSRPRVVCTMNPCMMPCFHCRGFCCMLPYGGGVASFNCAHSSAIAEHAYLCWLCILCDCYDYMIVVVVKYVI